MTLDLLKQLALRMNPTLMEILASVNAANGHWVQVGLRPNSVAGVAGQKIGNEGAAGKFGAFVVQEFVTTDKLSLNRNGASWDVQHADPELAAHRLRVLTDVRRGFYSVLVAQERLKVAEEPPDLAQQAVGKVQEISKVQGSETVLAQAEIETEVATILVDNSQTQRDARWRQPAIVTAHRDMPQQKGVAEPTADALQFIWEQTLDCIRRESSKLGASAVQGEQSQWVLQRACALSIPNVTPQTGVLYDDSSNDPFARFQMSMSISIRNHNPCGIAKASANVIVPEPAVKRVDLSFLQRLLVV